MEKHSYEQREQHAVALSGYQVKHFGGKLFGSLYGNIKGARASMTPEIWGILEKAEYDLGQKYISDWDDKRREEQLRFWHMLPYPIKVMVAAAMGKTPGQVEAILSNIGKSDSEMMGAYIGASSKEPKQEGVRVSGQQIPGTKNRAKTAYYPTNVPPKVKKLDKPLTDKELARLSNQGVKEDGGRAVDVNGWTQQDWIQAVKRKFPAAKIIQAKMIDGPCQAVLPNGRTLYWNPVQAMAESAPRVDSLVTNGLKIMRGPTWSDAVAAIKHQVGQRDYRERKQFYDFFVRQLVDMYSKKDVAEGSEEDYKKQRMWDQHDDDTEDLGIIGQGENWAGIHRNKQRRPDKEQQKKDVAEGKKVDSFVTNVKSSEKKAGHSDKEAEDIAWATANKRGMLDNKNKKKVHETIAPITVDEILEGLDADQKRVGQVGGKEKAKKIGTVLGTAPKKHPFNKRLVGE
jgi:hypothetical protein